MTPIKLKWSREDSGDWAGRSPDGIVRAMVFAHYDGEGFVIDWQVNGPDDNAVTFKTVNSAKTSAQRAWFNWVMRLVGDSW